MNNRIVFIDRLKGFAIFIVVIAHFYTFAFHGTSSLYFKFFQSFEMYLFMWLSGYVAYVSPMNVFYKKEIYMKLIKRAIMYVCSAFVLSWIVECIWRISQWDFDDLFNSFWEGYWYLKSLAIYSLLQIILHKCNKMFYEFLICIIAYILFFVGWKICPNLNFILSLEYEVCFFPFFMLGYYSKKYYVTEYLLKYNLIFTGALIFYLITFCINNWSLHILTNLVGRFLMPLSFIIIVLCVFMKRENNSSAFERWLESIGGKTLDIYLYHMILMSTLGIYKLDSYWTWATQTANQFFFLLSIIPLALVLVYMSLGIGYIVRQSNLLRKLIYGEFVKNNS